MKFFIRFVFFIFSFNILLYAEWSEEQIEYYCKKGDIQECVNLGIYDEKRGAYNKAYDKYFIGCNKNIFSGCYNLGRLYKYGLGVEKNMNISNQYYNKACELNSPKGCYQLAKNYEQGFGINKDLVKSSQFYKKACDLGESEGCWALAWLYKKGLGVELNYEKSFYYYNIACRNDIAEACAGLAGFFMPTNKYGIVDNDYNKGVNLFKKACNLGHEKSCSILLELKEKE